MDTVTLGRVRMLDRPIVPPGKCCMCGSAAKPVLDTGFDVNGFGAVYFCVDDIHELGRAVGMVDRANLSSQLTAQELQNLTNVYLKSTNQKLVSGELYDGLRRTADLLNGHSISNYVTNPVVESKAESEKPRENSKPPVGVEPKTDGSIKGGRKPTVVQDTLGISDLAKLDVDFS